jgi:hypothetical protein
MITLILMAILLILMIADIIINYDVINKVKNYYLYMTKLKHYKDYKDTCNKDSNTYFNIK